MVGPTSCSRGARKAQAYLCFFVDMRGRRGLHVVLELLHAVHGERWTRYTWPHTHARGGMYVTRERSQRAESDLCVEKYRYILWVYASRRAIHAVRGWHTRLWRVCCTVAGLGHWGRLHGRLWILEMAGVGGGRAASGCGPRFGPDRMGRVGVPRRLGELGCQGACQWWLLGVDDSACMPTLWRRGRACRGAALAASVGECCSRCVRCMCGRAARSVRRRPACCCHCRNIF